MLFRSSRCDLDEVQTGALRGSEGFGDRHHTALLTVFGDQQNTVCGDVTVDPWTLCFLGRLCGMRTSGDKSYSIGGGPIVDPLSSAISAGAI